MSPVQNPNAREAPTCSNMPLNCIAFVRIMPLLLTVASYMIHSRKRSRLSSLYRHALLHGTWRRHSTFAYAYVPLKIPFVC